MTGYEDVMQLVHYGEEHRAYRETSKIHEHSSRSHTIFRIYVERYSNESQESLHSVLNLIDLAGSERLSELE